MHIKTGTEIDQLHKLLRDLSSMCELSGLYLAEPAEVGWLSALETAADKEPPEDRDDT